MLLLNVFHGLAWCPFSGHPANFFGYAKFEVENLSFLGKQENIKIRVRLPEVEKSFIQGVEKRA